MPPDQEPKGVGLARQGLANENGVVFSAAYV